MLEQPVINIWGKKVALGPVRKEQLPLFHAWENDFEVTRTLNIGIRPRTWEAHEEWYRQVSQNSSLEVFFTIYDRSTLQPIGHADLNRISQIDGRCEFGIMIGDKHYWNRGYGSEAVALMLDYGFNALNLYTILLRVFSFNERAIKVYERVGFKTIGRWRGGHRIANKFFDVIFMDCIAPEFNSLGLQRVLLDVGSQWENAHKSF